MPEIPPLKTPKPLPERVKPGDVWQLDRHRLICGDAIDPNTLRHLFGHEQWDVLVTSPPYAQQRSYGIAKFDWASLMLGVTEAALSTAAPSFHALINLGLVHRQGRVNAYWLPWLNACEAIDLPLYAWYVWDKLCGLPGQHHGRLSPAHEFIFHLARQPRPPRKWLPKKHFRCKGGQGTRSRNGRVRTWSNPAACLQPNKIPDSVIRLHSERRRGLHTRHHPAVFPIELPLFLLQTFGQPGSIVFEPFAGSGTTLLAAGQLGMQARAVEINPRYCDLILARFEQDTGLTAQRWP